MFLLNEEELNNGVARWYVLGSCVVALVVTALYGISKFAVVVLF